MFGRGNSIPIGRSRNFWRRARRPAALLNKGSLFTRDELAPLLDTSLPGMAEVAALLAIHELLDSDYDEVMVDTAPMGHAIRLFQMPAALRALLDVLEDGGFARCRPGAAFRRTCSARAGAGSLGANGGARRAGAVGRRLEVGPGYHSRAVLAERGRAFGFEFRRAMRAQQIAEIVLNRLWCGQDKLPALSNRERSRALRHDSSCDGISASDVASQRKIPAARFLASRRCTPSAHISSKAKTSGRRFAKPPQDRGPQLTPASWPLLETPLTLTVGKGGVGKTTISAALAFHHRKVAKNDTVTICSIDPAPSLDDVFRHEDRRHATSCPARPQTAGRGIRCPRAIPAMVSAAARAASTTR